ncbi:GntR family transcriptional regulator [Anaerococcus lactolyticus]|uniref:GntR family transcriptional regulator n=1 Tax=Anaerococcus lactolyticus S7-1-13 TaxID=1284686 RepID=A0A095X0B2_9FIRM|nr:GntR family transcriptional regulator [Anaerococcus lactolyticus]KGF03258.1 GntR family transcriptional regulator [Anaerococcus lactolyticus S7-1-13]
MASLYSDLIDKLLEQISTMDKGAKLPSERQLCQDYEVSRTTVRNALGSLVNSGVLYQIQGKGTFVRERNRENLSNYYSFTEQTKRNGKTPKSIVVSFNIRALNDKERHVFDDATIEKVIVFDRLRLADDTPMMYERTAIPYEGFENITKNLLEEVALYDIFDNFFSTKIANVRERFQVSSLTKKVAEALNLKDGSAALKITRFSYDREDRLIEYTVSYARGDMFYYETSYSPN